MGVWKCFTVVVYLATATSALKEGHAATTHSRRNADTTNPVIFDSSDIAVNLNASVGLNCGVVQGTEATCVWETEKGEIVEVQDVHNGDVHDTYSKPDVLTDNQCGIVIDSVQLNNIGTWHCNVFVGEKTFTNSKRLLLRNDSDSDSVSDSEDSLGGGAIAGIVIGVLGVGLLIGVVVGVMRSVEVF